MSNATNTTTAATSGAAELIREMQENVAKYGGENTATFLMVQAIEKLQRMSTALAAPAQAAAAKQSPHPEYDKGFSDGWNRCEERQAAAPVGMEPVATVLFSSTGWRTLVDALASLEDGTKLYTAAQVQAMLAAAARDSEPTELQLIAITTAYEQGVGKGHQAHASCKETTNPYSNGWRCDQAWKFGYDEGKQQAQRIAAAPSGPAREPLSQERLQFLSGEYEDIPEEGVAFRDGWRSAEMHHGITAAQKGGQHG